MAVVIETTIGDLTVDLFLKERPRACLNFLKLCKLKYYNYNLFHTIEHGFIAQTGDPTGVGDGGESVWGVIEGQHKRFFEAEYLPKIRHSEPGFLSMVSLGDNLIGSQFFFTLGSDLTSLDGIHCVIGQVTEGFDVLRKLNEAICDNTHRPYQDIRITHTIILEDPFENPRGFREPSRSPSPSAERLKGGRIGADEEIDDTSGKTEQEIKEMMEEREAKARATILEIVGDLPDAEVAPPENVLFVCKLNSVTTDDDLEIIFSRFGKVKGCEVIRDRVSGDSLQYAFVEFEDRKACEAAYFKMDNVLIDDRRIHVDFSQSVSKVQWRGKGRGLVIKDGSKNNRIDFSNYKDSGEKNKSGRRSPNRPARFNERDRKAENGNRDRKDRRYSRSPVRDQGNRFRRDSPRRDQGNRFRRSSPRRYRDNNRRSPNRNFNPRKSRSRSPRRFNRDNRRQRSNSRSPRRVNHNQDRDNSRYERPNRSTSRSRVNYRMNEARSNEKARDSSSNRRVDDRAAGNGHRKNEDVVIKNKKKTSSSSSDSSPKSKKKSKKSKKSKKHKHNSSDSESEKKHKKSKKKKDKKSKKSKKKSSSSSDSDTSSS